jgi:hypothetical protein
LVEALVLTAALLLITGCFDKSTQVPQAPIAAGNVTTRDPKTDAFTASSPMLSVRRDHASVLLKNGNEPAAWLND